MTSNANASGRTVDSEEPMLPNKTMADFILRRMFPWSWAPPPLNPVGGGRASSNREQIRQHTKFMEQVDAERKRLLNLRYSDLRAIYDEYREKDARRAEAEAEKRERGMLFNAPGAMADFQYWGKAEYWTFEEAVALLLGRNPKVVSWPLVKPYANVSHFARKYDELRNLAIRATAMTSTHQLNPHDVVAWARSSRAIEPPEELVKNLPNANSHAPAAARAPAAAARPPGYSSLEAALEGHFEKAKAMLPPDLRDVVEKELDWANDGYGWDALGPEQRRSLAQQRDAREDPARKPEREFYKEHVRKEHELERRIEQVQLAATPTATDIHLQAQMLKELQDQLEQVRKAMYGGPTRPSDREGEATPAALPKHRRQEERIIAIVRQLGADPLDLPVRVQGKSGVKARVWAVAKEERRLFQSKNVFDKAWDRLRAGGELAGDED